MTEEEYHLLCGHVAAVARKADRIASYLGDVGAMRTNLDLFESGWADAHGNHRDELLWTNNHYRGGWMAAPVKREG